MQFSYDHSFSVALKSGDEAIILQEETDGTLFMLHNDVTHLAYAVSIRCIGPNSSGLEYDYDISVRSQGCSLKLESFTMSIQCPTMGALSSRFLLIPSDYFGTSEPFNLEICIWSNELIILDENFPV